MIFESSLRLMSALDRIIVQKTPRIPSVETGLFYWHFPYISYIASVLLMHKCEFQFQVK